MAQVKTPQFGIVLRRNRNRHNRAYGKYFPEAQKRKTISTRGLCDHMMEHQTVFSRDVIEGVITKAVACMAHLLAEGNPLKLNGLGTFEPKVESTTGGITVDDLKAGKWNPEHYIAGIHLRFLPEGSEDDKFTSRAFKSRCSFSTEGVLEPILLSAEGETPEKWGYKTVPLDTWLKEQEKAELTQGGDGGGD